MAIRDLKVEPVIFRKEVVGYSIAGIYRDCTDSFWEPITHNAIFRTKERAEKFFAKFVAANSRVSMKHWNVGHNNWDQCYTVL